MPTEAMGVLIVAKNPPVEFDCKLAGEVTIALPAKFTVMSEFGAKFKPLTVTDVPRGPLVGLIAKLDGITSKVVEEKLKKLSARTTILLPGDTPLGTVKKAPLGMLPDWSAIKLKVACVPLTVTIRGEFGWKPWPETVTF